MTPEVQAARQAVFDRVWDHFVTKGNPRATEADGRCRYRTGTVASSPVRCAIGLFIPDGEYNPSVEGAGVGSVIRACPSVARLAREIDDPTGYDFLAQLQQAHDGAHGGSTIDGNLRHFALLRGLTVPAQAVAA